MHAKSEFQRLLEKNPRHAEAHHQLSRIQRYEKGDDHIKAMQLVLKMANPSAKETVLINHGLGKAHSDLKDYAKAFAHWQAGNRAFKKTIKYDFAEDQEVFDRLHQWAGSCLLLSRRVRGNEAPAYFYFGDAAFRHQFDRTNLIGA